MGKVVHSKLDSQSRIHGKIEILRLLDDGYKCAWSIVFEPGHVNVWHYRLLA